MKKKVLLICWDFPPNNGIGGRRWGKFAKGLTLSGYEVHVLKSAPLPGGATSPWTKDVQNPNIFINEVKTHWAVRWLHNYNSILSSVKIRVAKVVLSFLTGGTIFDKAVGVEKAVVNVAEKIIETQKINVVIATGAPFNLLYYAALLKKRMPRLRLIADYRDPWLNSVNYGMDILSNARQLNEKAKQDFLFNVADVITAPNSFLLDQIKDGSKDVSKRPLFFELGHFYDRDDTVARADQSRNKKQFRIMYAGALYTGSEKYQETLFNGVQIAASQDKETQISLDVYTDHTPAFSPKGSVVSFLKPKGEKIFSKLNSYDLIVILLTHHNKDFKTTKFFEFMPYGIPYLYVGPEGHVSEAIKNERLGFHLTRSEDLPLIIEQLKTQNDGSINREQVAKYELMELTRKLVSVF